MYRTSIANGLLRVVSLGSRLVLLLGMAWWLEPADLGVFGLLTASITLCVLLVGGDFYTYVHRDLLSHDRASWSRIIQHQLVGQACLYLALFPLLLVIFAFGWLDWRWIYWFYSLLLLENMSMEAQRLLVAMGKPIAAGRLIFLRMGGWVWLLLIMMLIWPSSRDVSWVLAFWFAGCSMALIYGGTVIAREIPTWKRWPVDARWILRGIRIGLVFLVASLALRAQLTVDRYIVEDLAGTDMVGVYSLYAGLAMTVVSLLDATVLSFLYPKVVAAFRRNDIPGFRRSFVELAIATVMAAVVIAGAIAVLGPVLVGWLPNEIYSQHVGLLWLLLIASLLYGIGMVPHYGLYALGADKCILAAHVSSLAVFLAIAMTEGTVTGVCVALVMAFLWLLGFKGWCYRKQSGYVFGKAGQVLE